jgi:multiple sugar transport system permease protein
MSSAVASAAREAATTPIPTQRRANSPVVRFGLYAILTVFAAAMIVPFLWMISTSLKAPGSVLTIPPHVIPAHPTTASFRRVTEVVPLGRMFVNSLFVTTVCVLAQLITGSLAAYAFARMRWSGRDKVFMLYLATLMVPSQVTITPLFILMRQLGWINTYQGLILPGTVSAFGTFLLRQAMLTVPREYEEAFPGLPQHRPADDSTCPRNSGCSRHDGKLE